MTRHELKEQLQHDQFSDAVSDVVGYALSHRQAFIRWSIVAIVVLVLVGGGFWYSSYKRSLMVQDLQAAFEVANAQVGPANQYAKTFPAQDAKTEAAIKAFTNVVNKDAGTREGYIAQYYRGTLLAQKNDLKGAESDLRAVAASNTESAALAKIALAQVYAGENKISEARALLQSLVNKPADLVSKAQAQVLLAHLDEKTNPQLAKSILQSLKTPTQDPAVTRAVDELTSQLNQ